MTYGAWRLTYDGGQHEDDYTERPSEFIIRQTQKACPDMPVKLWYEGKLIEEWPALQS